MITVQRQNLLRTVERVAKFSDARSSMPALACMRIEWTGDTLRLTATNLTAHAVASVAGTGADAAWSALAYAKELIKALKSLPGDEIGIDKEGLQIEICASGCAIKVAGVDPSVWPKLTPPAQDLQPVNSAALADSLLSVLPATSTDETRGHLMAVHVESDIAGRTVFVTTDGHRLDHIVRHDVCMPPTDAEGVSLPGPEISIVARLIRPTYPVRWGWHEGHVTIELGGLLCVLRLVNVQFPPYHQVIPDASSHTFRIDDVSEWIQATQAMASMAEEHFVTLGIGADVSALSRFKGL